ncbi:hypothetical protein OAK49_04450 [Euryarchaeota archaeon]|nr:hypothetical protein [Euryarchaeota archaeon]|tara:strand:- start:3118 stop:3768 length:651 start_codon:yes stop_codon:yes gene_type:complete
MASGVGIVAFGRPDRTDAASRVLHHAIASGAEVMHVSSSDGEEFHSMDHGSIDWREVLDSANWLINSSNIVLDGESPRMAWAASMIFAELEGSKTVMVVSVPDDPGAIEQSWGAVISKIRQIQVLFIDSEAIAPISEIEGIEEADLLTQIRLKGMVPIVCTYDASSGVAMVEHSTGSVKLEVGGKPSSPEWLSRFLCKLPETGPGDDGIRRATAAE